MNPAARANPSKRPGASAFTLLELILVLVIVATLLSVSAASLRGLQGSQGTRAAAEHFMSLCGQARTRAITEARPYRITLDVDRRAYWLSRAGDAAGVYEPVATELGRRFELDERFTLTCEGAPIQDGLAHLDFFPDGRSQPFRVTFQTPSDRFAVVHPAMAEPIRIE